MDGWISKWMDVSATMIIMDGWISKWMDVSATMTKALKCPVQTHTANPHCKPTLQTHTANPHCKPTLQTHTANPHCKPTLQTHTANPHCKPTHQLPFHNPHINTWAPMWVTVLMSVSRVGQNQTFIGIYGVNTVFLAGKSSYIRSYTVCIYGSGQP